MSHFPGLNNPAPDNPTATAGKGTHPGESTQPGTLSGQQYAEIAARAEAATPGPWMADGAEIYRAPFGDVDTDQWIGETLRITDEDASNADAEFVAHSRTDVPALLADNAALRDALAQVAKTLQSRGEGPTDGALLARIAGTVRRLTEDGPPEATAPEHHAESEKAALLARVAGLETAGALVFRASHDSFVFGLYATAAAAREHCEAHVRREWPTAVPDWIEDEEDGVSELYATVDGEEAVTGYAVTALTVAATYDPEVDE